MDKRAWCGLIGPAVFIFCLLAAIALYNNYDPTTNYISDLGAADHSSTIFRIGAGGAGILGIAFSWLLAEKTKRKIGAAAFLIASISMIGIAIFNAKFDAEQIYFGYHTHFEFGHVVSAVTFFFAQIVACLVIGYEIRKSTKYFVMASGVIGTIFIVFSFPFVEHIAFAAFCISTVMIAVRFSGLKIVKYE